MDWYRMKTGWPAHRRTEELSAADVGYWLAILDHCAAQENDGFVTRMAVKRVRFYNPNRLETLLRCGQLIPAPDGSLWVRDWDQYQPLKRDIQAKRAQNVERQKRHRKRHAEDGL